MRKFSVYNLIGALGEYAKQNGGFSLFNSDDKQKDDKKINSEGKNRKTKSPLYAAKYNSLISAMKRHDAFVERVSAKNK